MSTKTWKLLDELGATVLEASGSRLLVVDDEGARVVTVDESGDSDGGHSMGLELCTKALEAVCKGLPPGAEHQACHSACVTLRSAKASQEFAKRLGIPTVEDAMEAAESVAAEVIADLGRSYPAGEGLDGNEYLKAAQEMAKAIRLGIAERLAPKG